MSKTVVSAALVSFLILLTNADCSLASPETLEQQDRGFTARLVLREDTQMLDAVRWGLNGDLIRRICPFCDYMELRSDTLIWLPFPVTWDEEADLSAYDPDLWVRIGERWYGMVDYILPIRDHEEVDYVHLGPLSPLRPGTYRIGPFREDTDPLGAAGALAFHRTRAFDPEMIEEMLFTANKKARPLRAGKSSLQVSSAMTRE